MAVGYLFKCPLGHNFSSSSKGGIKICPRCGQKGTFEKEYTLARSGGQWPPPYDYIDSGCLSLVYALNRMPGIRTMESCDGHYQKPLWILFVAKSLYALVPILKDHKLFVDQERWMIRAEAAPPSHPEDLVWFRLVTDLVGDEAYASADLFASLLEASCAQSS